MNPSYEPQQVEGKWQQRWAEARAFAAGARPSAEKRYVLEMFPYPSGAMHMGHVRVHTIGDAVARYLRMRGYDVLHPIGFDALGLPAENAALKDRQHPAVRTRKNIEGFRAEIKKLGYSFDWEREIVTCDPEYYRWNQWFFLKMLEKGLVYRRQGKANWCTGCLTVIANEQVVDDQRCERCSSPVVEKVIPEWAFRITSYAEELLAGLDRLRAWPDRIPAMQRHWIGRSEGSEVDFVVAGTGDTRIRVFTTRLDTIFGCTHLVVAPEHPIVSTITAAEHRAEIASFAERALASSGRNKAEPVEKLGAFTGAFAINPYTKERVPVWVANFVVADYGHGAVMCVPAHDQRDFEFAKRYELPIRTVIEPTAGAASSGKGELTAAFTDDGVLRDSGSFSGLASDKARQKMAELARTEGFGSLVVRWHLRDWGFSRQRYWGTPIPIIYCDDHGAVGVPESDLPVVLPREAIITGTDEPPLAKVPDFVSTKCPKCGKPARREVETMDTFVDSSWYYARYISPHSSTLPIQPDEARRWLPIDVYVGGPEHAVLHLLYFRFWQRVMRDLGLTTYDEPCVRLITQGIVNGSDGRKMSKRWGNVAAPGPLVAKHGADALRLFILFSAPPEKDIDWSDSQLDAMFRFLVRVWRLFQGNTASFSADLHEARDATGPFRELRSRAHRTLKKVTEELESGLGFNTAIASMMELCNALSGLEPKTGPERAATREALTVLATVLSPFAPHVAEELWHEVAGPAADDKLLCDGPWQAFDPSLVVSDTLTLAVQVNGKLRGQVQVPAGAPEQVVRAAAEALPRVIEHFAGKTLRKVIFVQDRLINFVAN